MVVLGSSSRLADEVHIDVCRERHIEVLRRSSGGATVIAGPGCLMYALVLDRSRPELRGIDTTHQFVLERLIAALDPLAPGIVRRGTCDLALAERKFSGNALRVRRHWLLYHGTLLYSFPLRQIEACLGSSPAPAARLSRRSRPYRVRPQLAADRRGDSFGAGRGFRRQRAAPTLARRIDARPGREEVRQRGLDEPSLIVDQFITAESSIEIVLDHGCDDPLEIVLRLPAQALAGLRRVAAETAALRSGDRAPAAR